MQRNILKYGLLLGGALCLYTTLMWLTRLDSTYLRWGQQLDVAVALLPLGLMLAAVARQRAAAGRLSFGQRLAVAAGVGLLGQLIYAPFLYAYHQYLHPEWFSYVLATRRAELQAAGQSAAAIGQELARLSQRQAGQSLAGLLVAGLVPMGVLFPLLAALLSLGLVRNRPRPAGA